MSLLVRNFGTHGDKVSALGLGGHHLGDAENEQTAIQIVHEAVDGGITFFDNCWEYNRGKSENWMGKGLKGRRDRVFLMTKVCTHGRDASLAAQMLEESLRRLQTDHLDLWQIHGVCFDNDPELFIRPNGAAKPWTGQNSRARCDTSALPGTKIRRSISRCWRRAFRLTRCRCRLTPLTPRFIVSKRRYCRS